jgi:hypothetical protein
MKILCALAVWLIGISITNAQTTNPTDSLYIVTYTTGSLWDVNKKTNEQPYFKEHSANLSALRKAGTIRTGARYGEKGFIIIAAQSMKAAQELILTDVAIVNKLFIADIKKLNVFYDGCIERPK